MLRRVAMLVAALGALTMSSGVALMATAGQASAAPHELHKDWVCKYVGTPGVNEHLKNGNDGLIWVDSNATQGSWFNDQHGRSFVLLANAPHDPRPSGSLCPQPENEHATAGVSWTEPTCANQNVAGYQTSGGHVSWSVVTGSAAPGAHIELKATAVDPYEFSDEATSKSFEHTYDAAVKDCGDDEPAVATASITVTQPSCANENTAAIDFAGENVVVPFAVTGTVAPGGTAKVTATAVAGAEFAGGQTTKVFDDVVFEAAKDCEIVVDPPAVATASITVTQPSCANENTAAIHFDGENVVVPFDVTGTVAPGGTAKVTATAVAGAEFAGGQTTKVFDDVVFEAAKDNCGIVVDPPRVVAVVAPQFVDATCESPARVVLPEPAEELPIPNPERAAAVVTTTDVNGVHYEISGDVAPGGTVEVTASAIAPAVLAEGAQTSWTHTFPALTGCEEVEPPVGHPEVVVSPIVTPTVVSSGLAAPASDLRGHQGLVLLVTGMILMVLAGGLGLARPGRTRS